LLRSKILQPGLRQRRIDAFLLLEQPADLLELGVDRHRPRPSICLRRQELSARLRFRPQLALRARAFHQAADAKLRGEQALDCPCLLGTPDWRSCSIKARISCWIRVSSSLHLQLFPTGGPSRLVAVVARTALRNHRGRCSRSAHLQRGSPFSLACWAKASIEPGSSRDLNPSGSWQNRHPRPRASSPGVSRRGTAADLTVHRPGHTRGSLRQKPGSSGPSFEFHFEVSALHLRSLRSLSTIGAAEATTAWSTPAGGAIFHRTSAAQLLPRAVQSILDPGRVVATASALRHQALGGAQAWGRADVDRGEGSSSPG